MTGVLFTTCVELVMKLCMAKFYKVLISSNVLHRTACTTHHKEDTASKLTKDIINLCIVVMNQYTIGVHWSFIAPTQTTWQYGRRNASDVFVRKVHGT